MDKKLVKKVSKVLEEIFINGLKIQINIAGSNVAQPKLRYTMGGYVSRFSHTANAVKILIKGLTENQTLETHIGILLRSSILDFIQVLYIKEQGETAVDTVLSDHLHYLLPDIIKGKAGNHRQEIYVELYKDILQNYSPLFDDNFKLKSKKFYMREVVNVMEGEGVSSAKYFNSAKNLYDWYSKYDHFGIFSEGYLSYDNGSINQIFEGLEYLCLGILHCILILDDEELAQVLEPEVDTINKCLLKLNKLKPDLRFED